MGTLIDDLREVVNEGKRQNIKNEVLRIKLKEKVQLYVLDYVYNNPEYRNLIMYGGTSLRICYDLNRMSEDIDFETTKPFDKKRFALDIKDYFIKKIRHLALTAPFPGQRINRVEIRLPVLFELGLSPHEQENLIVKVEVNEIKKNYPTLSTPISKGWFSFIIKHYTLEVLMAGKVMACLDRVWKKNRAHIKGRDFYDLLWYMEKGIVPDKNYLLERGGYRLDEVFLKLKEKIEKIKPADILIDLLPMLENYNFAKDWAKIVHDQFLRMWNEKYKDVKF